MKILVANLGSTSFKYRLFDMTDERQLARGGTERIGAEMAVKYGVTDEGGRQPPSFRDTHKVAPRVQYPNIIR